jgi:hypothetical protein
MTVRQLATALALGAGLWVACGLTLWRALGR